MKYLMLLFFIVLAACEQNPQAPGSGQGAGSTDVPHLSQINQYTQIFLNSNHSSQIVRDVMIEWSKLHQQNHLSLESVAREVDKKINVTCDKRLICKFTEKEE